LLRIEISFISIKLEEGFVDFVPNRTDLINAI